jgi:hypothetical protein
MLRSGVCKGFPGTHRSQPASGGDGSHRAAGLPQSVPEHCDIGGSEGVEIGFPEGKM